MTKKYGSWWGFKETTGCGKQTLMLLAAAVLLVVALTGCEFHFGYNADQTARYHCEQATQLWRGYYPDAVFAPETIVRVNNLGTDNDFDACLIYAGPNQRQPWVYALTFYNDDDRVVWNPA